MERKKINIKIPLSKLNNDKKKQHILLLNKEKKFINELEIEVKKMLNENETLENIIFKHCIKDNIPDKELTLQIKDIYIKLINENSNELIENIFNNHNDSYSDNNNSDSDSDSDNYDTDDEPIINNDEANIKRAEVQQLYINDAYTELQINNRVMNVGPTGFGKTVVNYKLIDKLKPKITFIFTPRQNLNKQTIDIKYIKYLSSNNYVFYNYSPEKQTNYNKFNTLMLFINEHKSKNKNIIVLLCYQSCKTLIPKLININFKINLAICDEAHTRSSWALLSKEYHKLFLELNNKLIEKYIFATATPKSDMKISPYNTLFGKVIEHCQIYELIKWGILCDFETIVKNIDFDKKSVDLPNFIIETMIKYNKKKGIIYVNSQKNAKELFSYIKYKYPNFNTFIYISEKLSQDSFKNNKYKIKFNKDDIKLKCFENCINQCIIITCNKLSYGYDNVFIDLICFADPRQSEEDIRQITGRGLRNDVSKYVSKILHIVVSVSELQLLNKYKNGDNNEENEVVEEDANTYIKYKSLTAFLKFVIGECGKDIIDGRICSSNKPKTTPKPIPILEDGKDYSGDIIPSSIINELSTTFYRKYEKFLGFLRNHNVYNEETYNLIRERPENIEWMSLLGDIRNKYKKFCFLDIKSPENINYYQTLEECNKAYETIKLEVIEELGGLLQIRKLKLLNSSIEDKIQKKNSECGNKIPSNKYLFYYNEVD